MLYVFSTCRHFIRTVPALVYAQVDVEDVDTAGEDHIYDACRYVLMAHPCARHPAPATDGTAYDPLSGGTTLASYAGRMQIY